jgi:hypothetical protein
MAAAHSSAVAGQQGINALTVHVEFGRFDFSGYPNLTGTIAKTTFSQ